MAKMIVRYQEDLDAVMKCECGRPDCGQSVSKLYISGRCHPDAPLEASYRKGSGVLILCCAVCQRKIMEVAVECRMTQRALTE